VERRFGGVSNSEARTNCAVSCVGVEGEDYLVFASAYLAHSGFSVPAPRSPKV